MSFSRIQPLHHDLGRHYPALRQIRRRESLLKSPLYREIGPEIERVVAGIERGDRPPRGPCQPGRLRVAAWNIQRGTRFPELLQALTREPALATADVLLLVEVDCGMGRSGNRNVARELAEQLGMSYALGVSYLVLEDDYLENPEKTANTLALAGTAILSRVPLSRIENVDLPELKDKFSSSEKRLGKKKALLAELLLPDNQKLTVGACHLDSNASPPQRARQMDALLDRATAFGDERVLIGGDMNSTTYDAAAPLPLLRDLLHKYFVTGFRNTVEGYMTPEVRYERPLFQSFAAHGFTTEGYNDRAQGSYKYDLHSPYAIQKVRQKVGGLLTRLLQWKLRPWNGVVPARLDWFAGRNLRPIAADRVEAHDPQGVPVSDHAAILVDLALGE